MHELCYARSKSPTGGFTYGGVIVSNCDLGIGTYKPADMPAAYGANNHGSIVEINGEWYVFYHRHTNGTWYSRQGCAERIEFDADGNIAQVELTSCGLNGRPLEGHGTHPAHIACNLFTGTPHAIVGDPRLPRVMQDGRDGDPEPGYIANICDGTNIGFKYFDCRGIGHFSVTTRGYADGEFEIKTAWDGDILGRVRIRNSNVWEEYIADADIPDGENAVWLSYRGGGSPSLLSFSLS